MGEIATRFFVTRVEAASRNAMAIHGREGISDPFGGFISLILLIIEVKRRKPGLRILLGKNFLSGVHQYRY
jgi:hypothetical protein